MKTRDKILEIIRKHRNTDRGDIGFANIIYHALFTKRSEFKATTIDPLASLLVNEDGSRTYRELKYYPYNSTINIDKPESLFILNP